MGRTLTLSQGPWTTSPQAGPSLLMEPPAGRQLSVTHAFPRSKKRGIHGRGRERGSRNREPRGRGRAWVAEAEFCFNMDAETMTAGTPSLSPVDIRHIVSLKRYLMTVGLMGEGDKGKNDREQVRMERTRCLHRIAPRTLLCHLVSYLGAQPQIYTPIPPPPPQPPLSAQPPSSTPRTFASTWFAVQDASCIYGSKENWMWLF